jgi:ABC-type branched-subunit amino acid transport system ATPase component/ABC-type branched-subunit amino acid transport system permease subunit
VAAVIRSKSVRAAAGLAWPYGASAVALVLLPWLLSSNQYLLGLFVVSGIWAIFAISVSMLFRSTGLLSMAHGAFFGIGAYAVGVVATLHHGSFWLALLIGVVVCVVLGSLVGLVTLRLRSHYFVITTLSLGLVVEAIINNWTSLTMGAQGIPSIAAPSPIVIGGLHIGFEPDGGFYYLVAVVLVVAMFISARFMRSPFGRGCVAVRDNDLLASFVGLDIRIYRLGSFVLSTAMAAVAGSLYAVDASFIDPTIASYTQAFQAVVQGQVGGIASTFGPVLGAYGLTILPEALNNLENSYLLVYGVLLVVVILFFRGGLIGGLQQLTQAALRQRRPPVEERSTSANGTALTRPSAQGRLTWMETRPADSAGTGSEILRCEGVVIRYGGLTAIDDVDLSIRPGELLSVVGPNGAGKSSLFNGLTGATPLARGRVLFDGSDVTGMLPHRLVRRGMVRTFQSAQLFESLTTLENALVGRLRHLRRPLSDVLSGGRRASQRELEEQERVAGLLDWVGLGNDLQRRAEELPIGKKQRLAVAMALATQPRAILLDEPLAGLSDDAIPGMLDLFRAVCQSGIGIVLVEHRMRAVMAVANRVVVLDHGRKIAEGAPHEIGNIEVVVSAYLGSRFRA